MKTANRLVLLNRNTAGYNKDFPKTVPKITQNRITANRYAPSLYIHLTYKDVDRFQKGSVYELYCLKASQVSKVHARNVLVR